MAITIITVLPFINLIIMLSQLLERRHVGRSLPVKALNSRIARFASVLQIAARQNS